MAKCVGVDNEWGPVLMVHMGIEKDGGMCACNCVWESREHGMCLWQSVWESITSGVQLCWCARESRKTSVRMARAVAAPVHHAYASWAQNTNRIFKTEDFECQHSGRRGASGEVPGGGSKPALSLHP